MKNTTNASKRLTTSNRLAVWAAIAFFFSLYKNQNTIRVTFAVIICTKIRFNQSLLHTSILLTVRPISKFWSRMTTVSINRIKTITVGKTFGICLTLSAENVVE